MTYIEINSLEDLEDLAGHFIQNGVKAIYFKRGLSHANKYNLLKEYSDKKEERIFAHIDPEMINRPKFSNTAYKTFFIDSYDKHSCKRMSEDKTNTVTQASHYLLQAAMDKLEAKFKLKEKQDARTNAKASGTQPDKQEK